MKKMVFRVIMSLLVLQTYNAYAEDAMFDKMESSGMFDKIRISFVASCYTRGAVPPTQKIELAKIKAQYPDRVKGCSCLEEELTKVPNKTIFDDTRQSYQLYQEKLKAMKDNNQAELKALMKKSESFKPFMSLIVEKCGLQK